MTTGGDMKWHNHIEAMNTVGMFLGDYGITNKLIVDSAKKHGLLGIWYYLPDGSYYSWDKYPNSGSRQFPWYDSNEVLGIGQGQVRPELLGAIPEGLQRDFTK